ncbi:MAG: type II toxin-antitoxin system RelE/ParE family toxin [Candidatus Babeliales bacterium]
MAEYNIKKILEVIFYAELSGNEPVREWLKELKVEDRKKIGNDIMVVEYNWPVGMPLVKPLTKGLREVRTTLDNRIARVIFLIKNKNMVLLHGFIKKTEQTPIQDLRLAEKRASLFLNKRKR